MFDIVTFLLVATVNFDKSTYVVKENSGTVQPVLVLSTPLSFNVTLQVRDNAITATRKLFYMHYDIVKFIVTVYNNNSVQYNEINDIKHFLLVLVQKFYM